MVHFSRPRVWLAFVVLWWAADLPCGPAAARAGVTSEEVEHAIRNGVKFLKDRQRADGSWPEVAPNARTGPTSLVTLALLTAGEKVDSPTIQQALGFLRGFGPQQLNSTYAIGLQTMVYAAAEPRARPGEDRRQRRMARAHRSTRTPGASCGRETGLTPTFGHCPATTPTLSTHCWA